MITLPSNTLVTIYHRPEDVQHRSELCVLAYIFYTARVVECVDHRYRLDFRVESELLPELHKAQWFDISKCSLPLPSQPPLDASLGSLLYATGDTRFVTHRVMTSHDLDVLANFLYEEDRRSGLCHHLFVRMKDQHEPLRHILQYSREYLEQHSDVRSKIEEFIHLMFIGVTTRTIHFALQHHSIELCVLGGISQQEPQYLAETKQNICYQPVMWYAIYEPLRSALEKLGEITGELETIPIWGKTSVEHSLLYDPILIAAYALHRCTYAMPK